MVNSQVFPGKDMEFEVSTHNHLRDKSRPKTVTALFKQTSEEMFLEAYRILVEVCKGKELLPDLVAHQHQVARDRYRDCSVELSGADESQALPGSLDEPVLSSEQPGSASFTRVCHGRADEPVSTSPYRRGDEKSSG